MVNVATINNGYNYNLTMLQPLVIGVVATLLIVLVLIVVMLLLSLFLVTLITNTFSSKLLNGPNVYLFLYPLHCGRFLSYERRKDAY